MQDLRTVEEVFPDEAPICLVASMREWKHYHPEECPTPIREWLHEHYPDVVIEQLARFVREYVFQAPSSNARHALSALWPKPMFRLGFNGEQAKHFGEAWRTPPLDTPESPTNFYFLTVASPEAVRTMDFSAADTLVPV
jgi:hypothetical protein